MTKLRNELLLWRKNKICVTYLILLTAFCAVSAVWSAKNLFLDECDYIIQFADASGISIKNAISMGVSDRIYEYGALLSSKTSFLFPLYMFSGFAPLIFCIPSALTVNSEMRTRLTLQKIAYTGKYEYCFGSALSVSVVCMCFFAISEILSLIIGKITAGIFSETAEYSCVSECVNVELKNALLPLLSATVSVWATVFAFSFFGIAFMLSTEISFAGLIVPFASLISWKIGPLYSFRDTYLGVMNAVLPMGAMCGYSVRPVNEITVFHAFAGFLFYIVLLVVSGLLILRARRQPDYL